jgi:hypothetical protein
VCYFYGCVSLAILALCRVAYCACAFLGPFSLGGKMIKPWFIPLHDAILCQQYMIKPIKQLIKKWCLEKMGTQRRLLLSLGVNLAFFKAGYARLFSFNPARQRPRHSLCGQGL